MIGGFEAPRLAAALAVLMTAMALGLSSLACSAPGGTAVRTGPGPAARTTVRGVVRDSVSGAPLAKARITLTANGGASVVQGITDSAGRFELRAPVAGLGLVKVDVADGMPSQHEVRLRFDEPVHLDVFVFRPTSAGEPAPRVESRPGIRLRYFDAATLYGHGSVEGIATDSARGTRLAGVSISLSDESKPLETGTISTITDDDGGFRFERLKAGFYALSVYYQLVGRATIEVRRNHLEIKPAKKLYIDLEVDTRAH